MLTHTLTGYPEAYHPWHFTDLGKQSVRFVVEACPVMGGLDDIDEEDSWVVASWKGEPLNSRLSLTMSIQNNKTVWICDTISKHFPGTIEILHCDTTGTSRKNVSPIPTRVEYGDEVTNLDANAKPFIPNALAGAKTLTAIKRSKPGLYI
jgi:hypothetical protein